MNRIKKFFGMCEHNWRLGSVTLVGYFDEHGRYSAMSFKIKLICYNCGKVVTEKSKFFSDIDISRNYCFLKKKYYWDTSYDCIEALAITKNADLVKKSFAIKLNKKYNLNLTIDDL